MFKVLFVCHGNICRSPMAEYVLRDYVNKLGIKDNFIIDSAATSQEEIGNSVYPPVKKLLTSLNIDCHLKRARQINLGDTKSFDYIIKEVADEDGWIEIRNYLSDTCGVADIPYIEVIDFE